MKKIELKAWGYWMIFLIILFIGFGCKSTQTTTSTDEKEQIKSEKSDSTNIDTKVNVTEGSETKQAFKMPEIKTGVKNCDSLCDIAVENALSMINAEQNNGKNQLKLYYDKLQKTLYLYNKLKGSKDSISSKVNIKKEYYNINHKKIITLTKTTNILTKEQLINLWVGRIFWLVFFAFAAYKLRKKVLGQ